MAKAVRFRRAERAGRPHQGAVWAIEHGGVDVGKLRSYQDIWFAELNTGKRLWGSYGSYQSARRQVIEHFEREAGR